MYNNKSQVNDTGKRFCNGLAKPALSLAAIAAVIWYGWRINQTITEQKMEEKRTESMAAINGCLPLTPDKKVVDKFGQRFLLYDLDGDRAYDVEEFIGLSPGAYGITIKRGMSLRLPITEVEPEYFDKYTNMNSRGILRWPK